MKDLEIMDPLPIFFLIPFLLNILCYHNQYFNTYFILQNLSRYIKHTHLELFLLYIIFHKKLIFYFYLLNAKDSVAFQTSGAILESFNHSLDYVFY